VIEATRQRGMWLTLPAFAVVALSGCVHSQLELSEPSAVAPRDSASVGIGLPSPNAVLLGAIPGDEAVRNDVHMGSPTPGSIVVGIVERDWYQRDRVTFGRSYHDSRFTTRVREWSNR
jgi:hypothetical protein